MKRMITVLIAASLSVGVAATANAAINVNQINQQRLIDAGYRSGKLTRFEKGKLEAQQRSISARERFMRARHGGDLTKRDKRTLHALQKQAGRDIQREKYDRQRGRNKLKL